MNNTTNSSNEPSFADAAREREWQAQERALQAERAGIEPNNDARMGQYRLIARALREAPDAALPANFAASVARRARIQQGHPSDPLFTSALERRLLQVSIALFGILIGACAATYAGADVLHALDRTVARAGAYTGNSWLLALAACVALSAGMQIWQPRRR